FFQPSWFPVSLRQASWSPEPARAGTSPARARKKLTSVFSYWDSFRSESSWRNVMGSGASYVPRRTRVTPDCQIVFSWIRQVCALRTTAVKRESPLFRCLVLSEVVGREFAAWDVACVDFGELLPLFRQVVLRKNGRHRADGHAGAAIAADR